MSSAQAAPSPPLALPALIVSERLSGDLVRLVRLFHGRRQEEFAEAFGVSVRTVIRWEQLGIDPAKLPRDLCAADQEWRGKLLVWMLARYLASGSPDTRKKEA